DLTRLISAYWEAEPTTNVHFLVETERFCAFLQGRADLSPTALAALAREHDKVRHRLAASAARADAPPRLVEGAVALLTRSEGTMRVEALAPALGVTRQALARAFAEHVGVPPKTFARVVRMRAALARVEQARRAGWSRVALDLGYHDQAHLGAELRALTGRTPGEWARAG
ncbi:helix-turn-helix domain-containing protein, partial [Roseisolibacter sp. H3M3-2]|uniref:helix-turn-helix domain-containing protein n=1 Tax=Roseisolibacter sp. H3M3-2 TaxID=3031323 RepID=UPI0023DAF133